MKNAISDMAFYIVDGVYNDEFDDESEAQGESCFRAKPQRRKESR